MIDILLKNGKIIDGSGDKEFIGDVAVSEQTISAVESEGVIDNCMAEKVIDVSGLVIAPGFIDMHTHSDFTLIADGRAESQVHQGVTTEVIGQCGISCAPVKSSEDIRRVSPWYIDQAEHELWRGFGEYLDVLDRIELGVNVMAFVGHGTVHRAVLGDKLNAGESAEIAEMARLVDKCMDEGAGGLSSGLEYYPGSLASPEHLVPLCDVAAKYKRPYATHVRNRDVKYDLGFAEAISTARQSKAKLQVSHIQPKFGAPDYAMAHTLDMIESARRYDVDISFDVIPHDWSHTLMVAILPKWAQAGSIDDVLNRLSDPECREKIKNNPQPMWLIVKAEKWSDIVLLNAIHNKDIVGVDFAEIGRMRNTHPYDAVLDILLEEGQDIMSCMWTSKSFRNDDIDLCLEQSECAVISDTVAIANDGILSEHVGSLSGYGWAARFLQHYVRDRKFLHLRDAIAKLTSIPARRLGLTNRGLIKVGYQADICVFDECNISSNVTAKRPRQYASGIAHVLVNGSLSMYNGRRTTNNTGQVIREFAN